MQIVGKNKAIIHPEAFTFKKDYKWLVDFFGSNNIFEINAEEMYDMTSNVLSINDHTVVSTTSYSVYDYKWGLDADFGPLASVSYTHLTLPTNREV